MSLMKIVIVVLVLIVVLSICGIGAGFFSGGAKNNGTPVPWTQTIRDTLARPRPLSRKELQPQAPNCPTPVKQTINQRDVWTLSVQGDCSYSVPKSSDLLGSVRSLPLTLTVTPGTTADITLQQPGSITVKHRQPSGNEDDAKPLDVYKDGGTLQIVCFPLGRTCSFGTDIRE